MAQGGETDGGIAAGNEQIDGAVVVLPQGNAPGNRYVQTVVEGAGGIEPHHRQPINQKGQQIGGMSRLHSPQQQSRGACNCQQRACPMGNGRPGAQTVIGIPHLPAAPGPWLKERGLGGQNIGTHG